MGTKMKLMRMPCAVNNPDRFEVQVLEFVQSVQFGGLGIETLPAQYPVTTVDRPKIDDGVLGCEPVAVSAPCSFGFITFTTAHSHEE